MCDKKNLKKTKKIAKVNRVQRLKNSRIINFKLFFLRCVLMQ